MLYFLRRKFLFVCFLLIICVIRFLESYRGEGGGIFWLKILKYTLAWLRTWTLMSDMDSDLDLPFCWGVFHKRWRIFFPLSFFSSLHKSLPFFPSCTKSKVLQMSFKLKQKRKDNKSYSFLLLGPIYRKCSCYFSKTKLCVREDAIEWPSMVSWASTGFWVWFPAASVPSRSLFYS